MNAHSIPRILPVFAATSVVAAAGPYSAGLDDPANPFDAPVPGFVGPHGQGKARLDTYEVDEFGDPVFENPDNHVNPLFFGWATDAPDYVASEFVSSEFSDPSYALGPVTGDWFDVVSLGDLSATAIANGDPPGTITVTFDRPVRDLTGADFVVFENAVVAAGDYGGAGIGGVFAELAYVEVSADGVNFVRLPSTSLNPPLVGIPGFGAQYASLDPTNVHNLAGKHVNAYGDSWGTPFDLSDAGLSQVTHLRLVDVPGDGSFADSSSNPIYDAWKTIGSGGFDLEAVGVISTAMDFDSWPQLAALDPADRDPSDDPDRDGLNNLLEYAFGLVPWLADATAVTPMIEIGASGPEFSFNRDERTADLMVEVQVSPTMGGGSWTTIARSVAGAPMQAAGGSAVTISETSASEIASVGVLRRVTVRDDAPPPGRAFYRVNIVRESP